MIKEASTSFLTCKICSSSPIRFTVSLLNEEIIFGDDISLDLMILDGKSVLHIVDTSMKLSESSLFVSHGICYGNSVEGI